MIIQYVFGIASSVASVIPPEIIFAGILLACLTPLFAALRL